MEKSVTIKSGIITIREDGIMHIHITINHRFGIDDALPIFEARQKIAEGKKYPIVYTAPKFIRPTREVRAHLTSEKRLQTTLADAFVIISASQRLLAGMYMRMNKPKHPTQVFDTFDKAVEWLKSFVED